MTGAASTQCTPPGPMAAYRMVWKRRRLLWRSFRSRHRLKSIANRTQAIGPHDILAVMVVRNEAGRLPYTMQYYRKLGVSHFLVVDNASTDDTAGWLGDQGDVSLWTTSASYRDARFGLDWSSWLLMRYGHGHWCLMVDADELLVYADHDRHGLNDLTKALDQQGRVAFGALMLDLYPKGAVGADTIPPGTDPVQTLCWFDPGPYRTVRQPPMHNLWVQGGARERVFFADMPMRSPTLNKLPLVRWNRRWAFVNSCHSLLPWRLNHAYSGPGSAEPSGVLLHTKFTADVLDKSVEDTTRRQHFHDPDLFRDYYRRVAAQPVLWHKGSVRYAGWRQLAELGLMSAQ